MFLVQESLKGMDEVNPDQADRELAHKAGVKQNKENAKAFLFLAQESLNGMDEQREVNPDQADRELAHKAGLFKSSVASELFLQKGQGGKQQDAASVFRVTSSCFFVCVSSFFLTHSAGKLLSSFQHLYHVSLLLK